MGTDLVTLALKFLVLIFFARNVGESVNFYIARWSVQCGTYRFSFPVGCGTCHQAMQEIERMLDWSLADDPVPEDEASRNISCLWLGHIFFDAAGSNPWICCSCWSKPLFDHKICQFKLRLCPYNV